MNLKLIFLTILFFQSVYPNNTPANQEWRPNKRISIWLVSAVSAYGCGKLTSFCAKHSLHEWNKVKTHGKLAHYLKAITYSGVTLCSATLTLGFALVPFHPEIKNSSRITF